MPDSQTLYVERALLPDGWAERVAISINGAGSIKTVSPEVATVPEGGEVLRGVLVPGIPNCHSHAFQRAMVGLTERRAGR